MDNSFIKQTLCESFEALKNSWNSTSNSLTNCIAEMSQYDGVLAMDMWQYILQKNEKKLLERKDSIQLIDNVLKTIYYKFEKTHSINHTEILQCQAMEQNIIPYIRNNKSMINLIYQNTINAGYLRDLLGEPLDNKYSIICFACSLFTDDPDFVYEIMSSLSKNKYMEDITMGQFILRAKPYVECFVERKNDFKTNIISPSIKESLLSSLGLIKDEKIRAESSIAIITINNIV